MTIERSSPAPLRIALYIGNELYPPASITVPTTTIEILRRSPLTSPILGLVNQAPAPDSDKLVYNDSGGGRDRKIFNSSGAYIGAAVWPEVIRMLKARGANIREVYLSFLTTGIEFMGRLISTNSTAANRILSYVKNNLGFDGIDLDYEGTNFSGSSPIYSLAAAAARNGLKLTAAPYGNKSAWTAWVKYVQRQQGTVSWLNLQCYAGGKSNNPGEWLDIGVPIVAGSCSNCGGPQTTCSPSDMQTLFTLWRTGQGSVSQECWSGRPNERSQAIGGGFIWVYNAISAQFSAYMNAVKNGLGMP